MVLHAAVNKINLLTKRLGKYLSSYQPYKQIGSRSLSYFKGKRSGVAKCDYIASLDFLRGIAVTLVVLFHSGLLTVGWLGVPVFFSLSGFLITRGLLRSKADSDGTRTYFSRFYRNRIFRIFPLYFFLIIFLTLISFIVDLPGYTSWMWVILSTFSTNFVTLATGQRPEGVVIHFWSLAVEEQFYLVWPLIVWSLSNARLKYLLWILILVTPLGRWVIAASLPASIDGLNRGNILYTLPSSHLDSLAVGALLALEEFSNQLHLVTKKLFCATLIFIGAHVFTVYNYWDVPFSNTFIISVPERLIFTGAHIWFLSIIATVCGIVITRCVQRKHHMEFLIGKCFIRLGKVSYSLYLLHVPIRLFIVSFFSIPLTIEDRFLVLVMYAPLSYCLAELSYRWIELPFLRLKDRNPC